MVPLDDGRVTIQFPAGAVERALRITARVADGPAGAASRVIELGPSGTHFRKPVSLAFEPGQRDVRGGIPRALLRVGTVREGEWEILPTSFPEPGVIEGRTMHFSPFALVAPCRAAGTGTDFPLAGCPGFNPRVQTSAPVTFDVTAGSMTARVWVTGFAGASPVDVTVSRLSPAATWFLREDAAAVATPLVADAQGAVRFRQDVSAPHLLLLSSAAGSLALSSSTCVPPIGKFDASTKTCALTQDVPDANVGVLEAGLTLDCKDPATGLRHRIGSGAAHRSVGVAVIRLGGVRVRNCDIVNVDFGTLVGQAPDFRVESVAADGGLGAAGVALGAVGFDQAGGGASRYEDVTAKNFVQGVGTTDVDGLVLRRAVVRTARATESAFGVGIFQEVGAQLEDVSVDGAPSGPGPTDPFASVPTGLVLISESTAATVRGATVTQSGAFGSGIAVIFGSSASIRDTVVKGGRAGVLLHGPLGTDIARSTLTENREGLDLRGAGPHLVFHNNILGNTVRQVFSTAAIELSDARPASPSFQQGNHWGRACPTPFVPGVDSNAANVADSFPFEDRDGWLFGKQAGCPPPAPVRITVDTTPPAPPVILVPRNAMTTFDAQMGIAGTSEALSLVRVFEGTADLARTQADRDGLFSVAPGVPLANGTHTVAAQARDRADNLSAPSTPVTFSVVAISEGAPLVGRNGLLTITSVVDLPDPYALESQPPNTLTMMGRVSAVQGLGGSARPLALRVFVRRQIQDARTGRLVAVVAQETPALPASPGARTVSVQGANAWDGRDVSGGFVAPGSYLYTADVAVTRTVPGAPSATPDCKAPFANLSGPCVVDFTVSVESGVTVLPASRPTIVVHAPFAGMCPGVLTARRATDLDKSWAITQRPAGCVASSRHTPAQWLDDCDRFEAAGAAAFPAGCGIVPGIMLCLAGVEQATCEKTSECPALALCTADLPSMVTKLDPDVGFCQIRCTPGGAPCPRCDQYCVRTPMDRTQGFCVEGVEWTP